MSESRSKRLSEKYRLYLGDRVDTIAREVDAKDAPKRKTKSIEDLYVGIVGGGMAGLYSALLLSREYGIQRFKIFEADSRLGGRVYTYRFGDEPYQYFEAGAMRLPVVDWDQPVFDLIDYLNENVPADYSLEIIPYNLSCPDGNLVYVNGAKQNDGRIMSVAYANEHPEQLGFPHNAGATVPAATLLQDAIEPVIQALDDNFALALRQYDYMSLHYYLSQQCGWSEDKIQYVEAMTSQTNEFRNGLVDQALLNSDFVNPPSSWKTINHGMCRLPEACAQLVGSNNIMMQTTVHSVAYLGDGRVELAYSSPTADTSASPETFDAVIMAIPPNSIRMMPTRPKWSPRLEQALRSVHFQPLYKIGLRFNSRFWERPILRPSLGGQSTTDTPSRWVVYPSYGIGDSGKGVLLQYSWMTDSNHWLPQSRVEKIQLALRYLQELYPEVNIAEEYAGSADEEQFLREAHPVQWAVESPMGVATFYPAQFTNQYPIMKVPRRSIYFAGEHLSIYHAWIAGALDSATDAVQQLVFQHTPLKTPAKYLTPKKRVHDFTK